MKRLGAGLLALVLGATSVGCAASSAPVMAVAPTVKAGSMARFIVHEGLLYALDERQLIVYDLTVSAAPEKVRAVPVNADAETLFPYGHLLFVGTRQGMLVYELADDPTTPKLIGQAAHVVSCDPVVVENDIAYVTLRSGNGGGCRQGINALMVFDVKDPTRPQKLSQQSLKSPHGLGIDGDRLFVADGKDGLLVFDVREPSRPKLIAEAPGVAGYDVIANAGTLFLSADDGLYQYRYGAEGDIEPKPLSKIPIGVPKLQVAGDPK
jgi:hypothetical protein